MSTAPRLSAEMRERVEREMAKYPERRGALLSALHLVEEEHGYIGLEGVKEVAALFELPAIEVMEVVSFYNMFHARPGGRHRVYVCTNLPCSLRGARSMLREIEGHLGICCGETSHCLPEAGSRTMNIATVFLLRSFICQANLCPSSVQLGLPG